MIPKGELEKAIGIAKKYGIGKMYLIGSALYKEPPDIEDYDFAVADIPPGKFFIFYGELLREMSKDVDIIDLSGKMTKFKRLVMKEGSLFMKRRQLKEYCRV